MKTTTVLKTHKRHYVTEMNSVCVYYEDLLLLYATPVGFKLNWMLPLPAKEQVRGGKEQFQTPASAGAQTASLTISPCLRQAADLERELQTPATLPSQQVGSIKSSFHLTRHTLISTTRMPSWKEGNSAAPKRRNGEGPEWSFPQSARGGPGGPSPPPTRDPFPGHRRAPPTPLAQGAAVTTLVPSGLRLPPGPRGPWPRSDATPKPSRPGPPTPAPGPSRATQPGCPQPSQGPGPPRAARPDRRAAHRVRLQALARLDGRCQRHRVVQQHLAGRQLLHEGHPGTRVRHRLGTWGRNRGRRLLPPAGLCCRRRCQHAPPHAPPPPPAAPAGS